MVLPLIEVPRRKEETEQLQEMDLDEEDCEPMKQALASSHTPDIRRGIDRRYAVSTRIMAIDVGSCVSFVRRNNLYKKKQFR